VGVGPTSYYLRPGRYPLDLRVVSGEREESYRLQVEVVSRDFPTQHLQVSASTASKKTREKAAEDWRKICAAKANSHNEALWYRPFTAPLEGRLSSEFGLVRYVNGRLSGRHSGIDVAVPAGTPVHAANAGYVVLSECLHIGGCTIILDHGVNVFSSYSHLSKRLVEVGAYVEHGEKIGEVGSTGFSTGPHLHWSMTIGITPTDPRKFLSRDSDIAPFVGSLQQELQGFGAGN
jgi:murein DD-endopeptidase MepM/ murein hydrolase activator NlpD